MLKRIINFDKRDWKHVWWLFTKILNGWYNGNLNQIVDAYYWIRIHLEYDSKQVN